MRNILIITVLIIGFTSCQTTQPRINQQQENARRIEEMRRSWLNRTEKELYTELGMPDRSWTDGANGKIVMYESVRSAYIPYQGVMSVKWITQVYIDSKGIIYDWKVSQQ